jgi:hypothetical protein
VRAPPRPYGSLFNSPPCYQQAASPLECAKNSLNESRSSGKDPCPIFWRESRVSRSCVEARQYPGYYHANGFHGLPKLAPQPAKKSFDKTAAGMLQGVQRLPMMTAPHLGAILRLGSRAKAFPFGRTSCCTVARIRRAAPKQNRGSMGPRARSLMQLATEVGVAAALALALWLPGCSRPASETPGSSQRSAGPGLPTGGAAQVGVLLRDARAFQGYTLIAPIMSTKVYLIDMQGRAVRTWETAAECVPSSAAYLLENGHLLRLGVVSGSERYFGTRAGAGGRLQEFNWEGELVWDFRLSSDKQLSHHDMARLPNGNVLMVAWDRKSAQEPVAAGCRSESVKRNDLLADALVEVKPTGKTTGEVVWEWHIWDHLIQDHDSSKANFGDVGAHPELIDINYRSGGWLGVMLAAQDGVSHLRSLGYVASSGGGGQPPTFCEWHINSVAYHPEFDQIVLSVMGCHEIWIIDHSTTSAQARGHAGGRSGKGGDLLYRWGNPRAYRAGSVADQRLFSQHDAHWIPRGFPGEGHLLVFSNGAGRPDGDYSSVHEIIPPVDAAGRYSYKPGTAYGPPEPVWSYTAPRKTDFFSPLLAGAQRLSNGNTLICSGYTGTIFELTPEKEVVWKYVNRDQRRPFVPFRAGPYGPRTFGPGPGGFGPGGFGPRTKGGCLFAARRYAPDYPGLAGKDLTPGKTIEEMFPPL